MRFRTMLAMGVGATASLALNAGAVTPAFADYGLIGQGDPLVELRCKGNIPVESEPNMGGGDTTASTCKQQDQNAGQNNGSQQRGQTNSQLINNAEQADVRGIQIQSNFGGYRSQTNNLVEPTTIKNQTNQSLKQTSTAKEVEIDATPQAIPIPGLPRALVDEEIAGSIVRSDRKPAASIHGVRKGIKAHRSKTPR